MHFYLVKFLHGAVLKNSQIIQFPLAKYFCKDPRTFDCFGTFGSKYACLFLKTLKNRKIWYIQYWLTKVNLVWLLRIWGRCWMFISKSIGSVNTVFLIYCEKIIDPALRKSIKLSCLIKGMMETFKEGDLFWHYS